MVSVGKSGPDFRSYLGEAQSPRAPVPSETLVEAGVCAGVACVYRGARWCTSPRVWLSPQKTHCEALLFFCIQRPDLSWGRKMSFREEGTSMFMELVQSLCLLFLLCLLSDVCPHCL